MKLTVWAIVLLLASSLAAPLSMARGRSKIGVTLVGAITSSMATGSPTPTSRTGWPGGGIIFDFHLSRRFRIELGSLYLTRVYSVNSANQQYSIIDGLLGIKWNLAQALYLDVGGYANYLQTNPQSLTGNDYGASAGMGIRLPLGRTSAILAGVQYHYALGNLTYGSNNVYPSEAIGLVGLTFGP